jgi:NTE family protein
MKQIVLVILISTIYFCGLARCAYGSDMLLDAAPKTNTSITNRKIRVGLALGGGGMRGAAHVGVLKILIKEGIPIDVIVGTSIGSAVGGFYIAGVPLDTLSDQFSRATFIKEFMPMPLSMRIILAPIIFIPRLFGYHPLDGLYKGEHCRKYADKLIGGPQRRIENLPIKYGAVCTNLYDGKSYCIDHGKLSLAMQASTSVPGIKKPVVIGDRLFCDGGLSCNVPVSHARAMGADFVIAVDIDENLNPVPLDYFRVPGSVVKQTIRIELANQDLPSCQQADFVIHPNTDGISLISRKKSDGRRGIEAGIIAAQEAIPELKRKLAAFGVELTAKDIPSLNCGN